MSNYFHCELCDKSIRIRSKKKYLSSKSLTESIIFKYTVENPSFFQMEDILKKYVDDHNKNLNFI